MNGLLSWTSTWSGPSGRFLGCPSICQQVGSPVPYGVCPQNSSDVFGVQQYLGLHCGCAPVARSYHGLGGLQETSARDSVFQKPCHDTSNPDLLDSDGVTWCSHSLDDVCPKHGHHTLYGACPWKVPNTHSTSNSLKSQKSE